MENVVRQAKSIYIASTEQSADSVESHPTLAGRFALGTYQIEQHEEEQNKDAPPISRKGRLRIFQSDAAVKRGDGNDEEKVDDDTRLDVQMLDSIDTAAILDMKWLHPSTNVLSVALADATVALYRVGAQDGKVTRIAQSKMNSSEALCLSLDWSDRQGGVSGAYSDEPVAHSSSSSSVVVSQSDGTLAYVADACKVMTENDEISTMTTTWQAHVYEAWCAAFDCWDEGGRVIWSGGDDLTLKGWDVRAHVADPTFTHKRSFDGGVTCMQSHHQQHLWAVGSYDEHVRLFDARQTARPVSDVHVGGGAWRVKWHPTKRETLLVGCMHDGFKVVEQDNDNGMTVRTRFDEHGSLAYGCDWDRGRLQKNDMVYSCSFYDATLHAWYA